MTRLLSLDALRWRLFLASILALGCAWIILSRPAEGALAQDQIPAPREGFRAPDLTLSLLEGEDVRLSDLRGQSVILNFWASWCGPCRAEMPVLQELHEDYAGRGVVVLAVNSTIQDSETAAREFAQAYGLTMPVALDPDGEATRTYLVRALPSTFFLDHEGVIRRVMVGGPLSRSALETTVLDLLGEVD